MVRVWQKLWAFRCPKYQSDNGLGSETTRDVVSVAGFLLSVVVFVDRSVLPISVCCYCMLEDRAGLAGVQGRADTP